MAWRDGEAVRRAVPGLAMFQVISFVQAADEGDGLVPGAKGPLARLGFTGMRQRPGVSSLSLRLGFRHVAFAASCGTRILPRQLPCPYQQYQPKPHHLDCLPRLVHCEKTE